MGEDGAEGQKMIWDEGGLCLAQDQDSSAVWGMPGKSYALGGVDLLASAEKIPEIIQDWTKKTLAKPRNG
jgi:two-component system chemotaxis response regulator CheB